MTVQAAVYSLIFIAFLRKAARKATSPGTRSRMAGLRGINVNDMLEVLQDEISAEIDRNILRRIRP